MFSSKIKLIFMINIYHHLSTNMTNSTTISIGMTSSGCAAEILDIKFYQKITPTQAHELMRLAQTYILECFLQTHLVDLNVLITQFLALFSDISEISLCRQNVFLSTNDTNEFFQEWFAEDDDFDIVCTINDRNVCLANEGSCEEFVKMLQDFDLCD